MHNKSFYTIKKLADLSHTTVRALHYYDQIGLLRPTVVKENGYRLYTQKDLLKLQQILFYKELEFSLERIKFILDDPFFDPKDALEDQKKLLKLKSRRINQLIKTINKTLNNLNNENHMKNEELYDSFSDEQIQKYKDEVISKYGKKAYEESAKKVKSWTSEDKKHIQEEGERIISSIAELIDQDFRNKDVQILIREYHQYMNNFYECNIEIFSGLGKLYIEDQRFTEYYEKRTKGLALFISKAIEFYCSTIKNNN